MQPLELPEFYVPYPARINPHLEAARAHGKAWARRMGMLDDVRDPGTPEIWDERQFDTMDYALLCAYTRRRTFGAELTMSLMRLGHGNQVPPEIYRTRTIRALERSVMDYGCLMNDIFSYQKEIEFEGELNNGVLAVESFLSCGRDEAVAIANNLMTSRLRQFEHITAAELPVLVKELDLDDKAQDALNSYVAELRDWLAGVLKWHRETRRYDESELRRQVWQGRSLDGPTGLGASATRLQPGQPS
jgi:germacradienol/geosmin synthase